MKNIVRQLSFISLVTGVCASVHAEPDGWPASYNHIGIEAGYNFSAVGDEDEGQDNLPDFSEFGITLGRQFNPTTSLYGGAYYATPEATNSESDVEMQRYLLGVRFHPSTYRLVGLRPVAGVGLSSAVFKVEDTDFEKDEVSLFVDLGLQRLLAKNSLLLEGGVRARNEFEEGYVDVQPFIGLSYLWGQKYPAEKVLIDTDGDGVPDVNDACGGTPAEVMVDSVGCTLMVESSIYQTLYLEFEFNQSNLREVSFGEVRKLAELMEQYPESRMLLEGHTDNVGSDAYNMQLSFARANEVRSVLVREFNVDPRRIESVGAGESQPIADNRTADGRSKNRRVEVVVSGVFKAAVKKAAQMSAQ